MKNNYINQFKPMTIFLMGIMFIFFLITLISLTSATDYVGKQYEEVNIVEICSYEGFPCSDTFGCNITIINPDNDLIILNEVMTQNETIYNYTFAYPSTLGNYAIKFYCSNITFSGSNIESTLLVTTTGRDVDQTFVIIILLVALVLYLIALFIKNHAMGFISGILFVIAGVYILIYGLTYLNDMYTRSIALVVLGFGMFIVLIAGLEWMDE